jgi:predicted amidohydrolase
VCQGGEVSGDESGQELGVAVAQFEPTADQTANRAVIRRLAERAADRGADLVVLPEYSSFFTNPPGPVFAEHAEAVDGPFTAALGAIAADLGVVLVAGLVEAVGSKVANTLVAVDADRVLATYRKQHLYDAFGGRESEWLAAGPLDEPQLFDAGGVRVGMQTCYDIRFPEVTRRLAVAGAELVLVPAEWVRGPLKEQHWRTLLAARAIENTLYVAGADHVPPIGVGASAIIDPMGVTLAGLGEQEDVAVAAVSRARLAAVRTANPSLALRRYDVVPRRPPGG